MSRTIFPTVNTTGVRRYYGLGAWGLGAASDTIAGMEAEGYDPSILNSLAAQGATDAQFQYLWDNFQPNTPDFQNAAMQMLLYGGPGTPAGPTAPGSATQGMTPTTGVTAPLSLNLPGVAYSAVTNPIPGGYSTGQPPPPSSINWSLWLQQNAGFLLAALAVLVVVPPVIKKL